MSKRKFADETEARPPAATIVMTKAGARRYQHRKPAEVRVTVIATKPPSQDVREMEAAEKALQASYNSLSTHLRMHRPCQDEALAPNYGSILYKLYQQKKLTKQQLYGWSFFWDDLRRERDRESSQSMVMGVEGGASQGNYASRELRKKVPGPSARLTKEGERARAIWHSLRSHERGLLDQMIRDALRTEGYKEVHAHTVDYLGGILSGYADNRQKIAAGVSAIQRLLSSIAEAYGVQPFET
jgi:hypothetical protein